MDISDPLLQGIIKTGISGAAQGAAWAWDTYGKEIKERIGRRFGKRIEQISDEAWQRVDWKLSSGKYRESIQEQYSTTRVLGKPEPITLEGIFTDVYILEKPAAFERYDIEQLMQQKRDANRRVWGVRRVPGLELVQEQSRLFILGKPGAGKTTFLKHIAWQAAQGQIDKIPIFVSLKDLADSGLGLMAFIFKQFAICRFPAAQPFVEHILETGRAIVLFDALDEVQQEKGQRDQTINSLKDFCQQYSESPCLITCRIAAVEYTFEKFKYVELADFTGEQIETYVSKWFGDDPQDSQRFFQQLNHPQNQRIRELASVPLQLSMLCLVFEETRAFPQRRVEIYQEALEALLKKWDAQRKIKRDEIYRELSPKRKEQMFARLAAVNFEQGDFFIKQDKLEEQLIDYLRTLPNMPAPEEIDSAATLKAIEAQHGILSERAARVYSFAHLTFQEYFTAQYIVSDSTGYALRGLLSPRCITDARWHEVLLNTVSLLDSADGFFELFLKACGSLVADEPEIVALLRWANERAAEHNGGAEARAFYLLLIIDLSFNAHYHETSLYRAICSDNPLDVYYNPDRGQTLRAGESILIDIPLSEVEERISADAVIDVELSQAYHLISSFEYMDYGGRTHASMEEAYAELLRNLIWRTARSGKKELTQSLRNLRSQTEVLLLSRSKPIKGWREILPVFRKGKVLKISLQETKEKSSDVLLSIMRDYRNIEIYKLDRNQRSKLDEYVRSNVLLLACLSLAAVTNRQTIKNSILLPPSP